MYSVAISYTDRCVLAKIHRENQTAFVALRQQIGVSSKLQSSDQPSVLRNAPRLITPMLLP